MYEDSKRMNYAFDPLITYFVCQVRPHCRHRRPAP